MTHHKKRWSVPLLALLCLAASARAQTAEQRDEEKAFEAVCVLCHSASMMSGLRTVAEWKATIDDMIRRGAEATPQQFNLVLRHLLRTRTMINVNTAAALELALVLDVSPAAAEAIIARREKAKLRSIEDLKQVRGVEPSKVDARKDRLAF